MKLECKCGLILNATIKEGNNPGCKERENVICPECGELLHSGIYNDAWIDITVLHSQKDNK